MSISVSIVKGETKSRLVSGWCLCHLLLHISRCLLILVIFVSTWERMNCHKNHQRNLNIILGALRKVKGGILLYYMVVCIKKRMCIKLSYISADMLHTLLMFLAIHTPYPSVTSRKMKLCVLCIWNIEKKGTSRFTCKTFGKFSLWPSWVAIVDFPTHAVPHTRITNGTRWWWNLQKV